MAAKTEANEIESIDIANDDLIDVLASLAEYERTNGASGRDERMIVTGDGPRKMAMPASTTNVVEDVVIYASTLVDGGEISDTIDIDGSDVKVNVL